MKAKDQTWSEGTGGSVVCQYGHPAHVIASEVQEALATIPKKIIDSNAQTSRTITEVQSGLKTGDVNKIKGHAGQLKNLMNALKFILPGVWDTSHLP